MAARPGAGALLGSAAAGAALTLTLPPAGLWPLGPVGVAVLVRILAERPVGERLVLGAVAGLVHFGVGLWWAAAFTGPGYVLLVLLESAFFAGAGAVTLPGRGAGLGLAGALVLAEAARGRWPFGGLPLAGLALGQADGPLAAVSGAAGPLGVTLLVGLAGVGLAQLVRGGRAIAGAAILAAVAAATLLGSALPAGRPVRSLTVAAVQGGGPRGVPAVQADTAAVLRRHLETSAGVRPPVDVVLWPEDVVDIDGPLAGSPAEADLADLARRLGTTLVVGVVEDAPGGRFRNAAVGFGPAGATVGRYDKVHRVPFGEYVPGRWLIGRLADLSAVPRDAVPGLGAGLLRTPAGRLGVAISFEAFFPERARTAVRTGAEVLLVPTNASSYRGAQVPAQQLAAVRLRARETGRVVVQAAPTGYSAVIDASGRILARSPLGRAAVLQQSVALRRGDTPYTRTGDLPVVVVCAALLLVPAEKRIRRPLRRR